MLSGWVKRDELVNVSEMMLPFACQTTVCSASSEDGICSLGVAGPGIDFLSLRREKETLPFWRYLHGLALPSVCLRRDLPAWHYLSF